MPLPVALNIRVSAVTVSSTESDIAKRLRQQVGVKDIITEQEYTQRKKESFITDILLSLDIFIVPTQYYFQEENNIGFSMPKLIYIAQSLHIPPQKLLLLSLQHRKKLMLYIPLHLLVF